MKFQIISDGSCDLRPDFVKENNVEVVKFYLSYDKVTHLKEGVDVQVDEFYQKLLADNTLFPVTSTPSIGDYLEVFTKYAKENIPMLCICITQKFSASYSSALNAKVQLLEEYPNAQIEIVDSIINTVLQGQLVKEVIKMRNEGYDLVTALNKVEEIKHHAKILFTTSGLEYLKNGGRIGKVSAIIGTLLKINPIITLTQGEIFSTAKATSRKRAIAKLKSIIEEEFSNLDVSKYSIVVGYCFEKEEAIEFKNSVAHILNVDTNDLDLEVIGPCIGVHTGPYALGIGYVKKYNA